MKATPDVRAGLPSASSFYMDVACPGRQNLLRSIPENERIIDVPDEMAARGSRIHAALETGDVSLLSEDEMIDWQKCKEFAEKVKVGWIVDKCLRPVTRTIKEERLWLFDGVEAVMSGCPDEVHVNGDKALVLDFKSGWCRNLTPSERNWQLRVLAVLVAEHYSCTDVRVGFIKPKTFEKSDITDYDAAALSLSHSSIRIHLNQSSNPEAHRSAGKHCTYCPAKLRCPEAGAMSLLPTVVAGVSKGVAKADVEAAVQRLGPSDWKYIHERASVIRNILDAATKCLKGMPADDLKALGLQVGEGRRLDPITNTIGAYKALEHTLKPEQLWSCLSFEKGKIVEAVMEAKGMSKKDAQRWVRETLGPFITEERASGSLEEV